MTANRRKLTNFFTKKFENGGFHKQLLQSDSFFRFLFVVSTEFSERFASIPKVAVDARREFPKAQVRVGTHVKVSDETTAKPVIREHLLFAASFYAVLTEHVEQFYFRHVCTAALTRLFISEGEKGF